MRRLLIFLFLVSLSFSSLVWEFNTDGPVSVKPVVFQNMVVVVSDDGSMYALDPASGARRWVATVGNDPLDLFVFDNALVSSTTSGDVVKIDKSGKAIWRKDLNTTAYNVSRVYGASANDNEIFVSANNGIYKISKSGNVTGKVVSYTKNEILTAPAAGSGYVIFGKDNELTKMSDTGQVQWRANIGVGTFWASRPMISGAAVYIGALDNKMYSYVVSNGLNLWELKTRNWIMSTATADGSNVYFGSNDGNVYAVDNNGRIIWKAPTQLAVKTQPETGYLGGIEVIFVGGSDRNIYAISKESGDVLWKGPAAGAVGSPLYYQNMVIVGSGDANIYAYSTERACSITSPLEGDLAGLKEVVVSGNYVSESGNAQVWVGINNMEWQPATETGAVDWTYYLDPSSSFSTGLNIISCRVVDASGQESGPTFTSVAVNHDPNIPASDLVVTLSQNIVEGKEFSFYVNDGDDGSPVERFKWALDGGEQKEGSKVVNITIPSEGKYVLSVEKIGFKKAEVTVNVNPSGVNPLYIVGGVLLIVIIIWQVWSRVLGKKFGKKKVTKRSRYA
jgi:outer membrane protein assembly factor BamB